MKKYEYKFVEVNAKKGFKSGDTFEECKRMITVEAENGWRLTQIVTPFNEKMGIYGAAGYQMIFEREL